MRAGWIHFETRQRWHFWLIDRTLCGFAGNKNPLAMVPPGDKPKKPCWHCFEVLEKLGSIYA